MQISGLGSGIDTAGMVKQLMSVERLAGQGLTTGRTEAQALVSAYTSLNSKMKSVADAAQKFVPSSVSQTPAWNAVSGKSSNEDIAKVAVGDKAQTGTLTFSVKSIAQAGAALGGAQYGATDSVNSANGGSAFDLTVNVGGVDKTINIGADAKLADVAAAINQQAGADVKATMVQTATGKYQLQLTAAKTGAGSDVTVSNPGPLGNFAQVAKGQDTVLHVGDATSGYDVSSTTREVKDLLPGVTINPVKADPATQVTVDLKANVDDMATKVDEMVKAANEALSNIKINSGYNKDRPELSGPFVGDSTTRDLTYKLREAFQGSSAALPSLAGISVDKTGTVTFDKTKFTEAYGKDPAAVQKAVDGVATKLNDVSKNATDSTKGSLALAIQGQQAQVKDYTDSIKRFEDRMTMRESTLTAQFNAMESMLSKMQAQGNWLNGQLAGLM